MKLKKVNTKQTPPKKGYLKKALTVHKKRIGRRGLKRG